MVSRKKILQLASTNLDPSHYTNLALDYCDDVLSGKIKACKQIKQACQRHLDDLEEVDNDPNYPYTFSIAKAEKACRFVSNLVHVSGRWAILKNNRFKVEPWQAFLFTSLFGWVHKATGFRRYREALLSVPRKNGKSFVASAICLYMLLADSEPGAQVFAAANNLEQAMTVFRPAKLMVDRLETLRSTFDIEANQKSIIIPDGSRFVPIVGYARDGQSAHLAVLDEYHEAVEDSLYNSLAQSMGARTQPLMLVTTTAGVTIEGPCHQFQRECEQVLEGVLDRPELFALIYTIDKDTDWTTEDALIMANPNLGVSVSLDALKTEHHNAIRNATKQNAFKTKKLNIWCSSNEAFFNMAQWAACADTNLNLDDFVGQECIMSADLSTKLDLTCVMKMFRMNGVVYCFPRFYLPSERANDPAMAHYRRWVDQGAIITTEGTQIEMERVLADTVTDMEMFKPSNFLFDAWKAEFYTEMVSKSCPSVELIEVPMTVKALSPPMLELEAMIAAKKIVHNGNPVMNWCMSNVVARYDSNSNVYPRKTRNVNKIDGAVALIMSVSRSMVVTEVQEAWTPFFA